MRKRNSELYRLLRFAIVYQGWHMYSKELHKHIKRGVELGFFEINSETEEFRLNITGVGFGD